MIFNRRKFKRKNAKDATVECESRHLSCVGKILNISDGGIALDIAGVPTGHEEFDLTIKFKNGKKLKQKAVVVWFIRKNAPDIGATVGMRYI
ncbi:PilZ domain-containing protein [Thermodesulfobacteriota bacterium]